jgi:hypothetical protein
MWQGRAEVLAERLAAAESRILALMPPARPPASNLAPLARWAGAVLAIVAVVVLLVVRW